MDIEPKPCPCGAGVPGVWCWDNFDDETGLQTEGGAVVSCDDCGRSTAFVDGMDEDTAIRRWNADEVWT